MEARGRYRADFQDQASVDPRFELSQRLSFTRQVLLYGT